MVRSRSHPQESIQAEKKFAIFIAQSLDANQATVIDDLKVYGKNKGEFSWPEELDSAAMSTAVSAPNPLPVINGYLHSFRQTTDEKDLATLSLLDRLFAYSMQVLTGVFALQADREKSVKEILPLTSPMLQLSLPSQLQRYSRSLLKELFVSECSSAEHVDRLQLSLFSRCFLSKDSLSFFPDLSTYESLLTSLVPISRSRPNHFQEFFLLDENDSSMEIFLQCLMKIFLNFVDQRPSNRRRQSLDQRMIDMKEIERGLSLLVEIHHHLALSESSSLCQPVIVEHCIRLLTHEDYRLNFLIKSALQRCLQPKSKRVVSKVSTGSDHIQEQDDERASVSASASASASAEKSFQSIPLSARVLADEDQSPWVAPTDDSGIL